MFSILVVTLNAGEKLMQTMKSILTQTCGDYEVVVKDGISRDDSVEHLRAFLQDEGAVYAEKIRIYQEKDAGIYEAMNQALQKAQGEYILFLNCGDIFYEPDVLQKASDSIKEFPGRGIYYGDTYCERTGSKVASPREITPFVCYRNIPCHQSCFYAVELFRQKPYDLQYKIRADYDQFLWCFFVGGANPLYMDMVVANYEGGGYSESKENQKRDSQEHRQITAVYMSGTQLFRFRLIMALTLAPLRRYLAESSALSGWYHKWKEKLYR